MTGDPVETAFLWDHDTHRIYIDTRRKSIISRLKKLGFKPKTTDRLAGYACFEMSDKELGLTLYRKGRKVGFARQNKGKSGHKTEKG